MGNATRESLEGIRVIDLATPLAEATGRVFAGLGAEVIKIEAPGGCESRFAPPFAKGFEGLALILLGARSSSVGEFSASG